MPNIPNIPNIFSGLFPKKAESRSASPTMEEIEYFLDSKESLDAAMQNYRSKVEELNRKLEQDMVAIFAVLDSKMSASDRKQIFKNLSTLDIFKLSAPDGHGKDAPRNDSATEFITAYKKYFIDHKYNKEVKAFERLESLHGVNLGSLNTAEKHCIALEHGDKERAIVGAESSRDICEVQRERIEKSDDPLQAELLAINDAERNALKILLDVAPHYADDVGAGHRSGPA